MKPKELNKQVEGFLNRNDNLGKQDQIAIHATRFFDALDAHQQAIADALKAVDAALAALTPLSRRSFRAKADQLLTSNS